MEREGDADLDPARVGLLSSEKSTGHDVVWARPAASHRWRVLLAVGAVVALAAVTKLLGPRRIGSAPAEDARAQAWREIWEGDGLGNATAGTRRADPSRVCVLSLGDPNAIAAPLPHELPSHLLPLDAVSAVALSRIAWAVRHGYTVRALEAPKPWSVGERHESWAKLPLMLAALDRCDTVVAFEGLAFPADARWTVDEWLSSVDVRADVVVLASKAGTDPASSLPCVHFPHRADLPDASTMRSGSCAAPRLPVRPFATPSAVQTRCVDRAHGALTAQREDCADLRWSDGRERAALALVVDYPALALPCRDAAGDVALVCTPDVLELGATATGEVAQLAVGLLGESLMYRLLETPGLRTQVAPMPGAELGAAGTYRLAPAMRTVRRAHLSSLTMQFFALSESTINASTRAALSIGQEQHTYTPVDPSEVCVLAADTRPLQVGESDPSAELLVNYWTSSAAQQMAWSMLHGYRYFRLPVVDLGPAFHHTWYKVPVILSVVRQDRSC